MKIAIIDYNLGNLFSVQQALQNEGVAPVVTSDPDAVYAADALLLPGVGAFSAAMQVLRSSGMDEAIRAAVSAGKPFMGVCLGMQLLFDRSEEFEDANGLGLVPGVIRKFPAEGRKVPQIGWNTIREESAAWENSPLKMLENGAWMYFVHSFFAAPANEAHVLARTDYDGFDYCSAVQKDNIFATQFHPEKSAEKGLSVYRAWIEMI